MTEPLPRHQGAPSGPDGSGASQGPEPDGAASPGGGRRIIGTPGDDVLDGTRRVETLDGRAGNDSLDGGDGADTLIGGDGDDLLWDVFGANRQLGGDGDDAFRGVAYGRGEDTLTGGAGRDTYYLVDPTGDQPTILADVITDFEAGPGGDVLDLDRLLAPPEDAAGPAGAPAAAAWNPFTEGFLRLVQDGDDTLLQIFPELWFTVVVLKGTAPEDLVAENFSPPYSPTGPGATIRLTGRDDAPFEATDDAERIVALGGDDEVHALAGDDTVGGGTGSDVLHGGPGGDALSGGRGNDTLDGVGDDTDQDTLTGGSGRDTFAVVNGYADFPRGDLADRITDFETGPDSDLLDIDPVLRSLDDYEGSSREARENPFGTGHLRLRQNGGDTLLQVNTDARGDDWRTLARLEGTAPGDFTRGNFSPDFDPSGAARPIDGTQGPDRLTGGADHDRIAARGGSDRVLGLDGNDTLDGGDGADTLDGGRNDDVLAGGEGADWADYSGEDGAEDKIHGTVVDLAAGTATDGWDDGDRLSGIENVVGSRWHDDLAGDAGDNALVGLADEDRLSGREGADTLSGGDGVDILDGGAGSDRMDGGAGVDRLIGGPGADRLAGGWAADKFVFRSLSDLGVGPGDRDVIRDFTQADGDRIVLKAIDADQGSAGNQAFAFIGADAFTGAGQIRFVQQAAGNRTLVEGNVDGVLAADFRIELVGLHDLSDRDFVL